MSSNIVPHDTIIVYAPMPNTLDVIADALAFIITVSSLLDPAMPKIRVLSHIDILLQRHQSCYSNAMDQAVVHHRSSVSTSTN